MTLLKADHRPHTPDHPQDTGRQRRTLHIQSAVAWAETRLTGGAIVVGAVESQRAQHAMECLRSPAHVAGRPATFTAHRRTGPIRGVGIEPLLDDASREPQRFPPRGHLHGLKIPVLHAPRPCQPFDLADDLGVERGFEAPFLAASSEAAPTASSWASAHCSQARQ